MKAICLALFLLVASSIAVEFSSETRRRFESFSDEKINEIFEVAEFLHGIKPATPRHTQSNLLSFAEGFLEGVGSASAFDEVKLCISDSENIMQDIVLGVEDIETRNPEKVKAGIELLGLASKIVPDAIKQCKASEVDLQNIISMVDSFASPSAFFYHVGKSLIINHVEVISEVSYAVDAYKQQKFTDLGYWVGKAMDTILLANHKPLTQHFADYLNKNSGWKAKLPSKFEGLTKEEIRRNFLGADLINLNNIKNLTVFNYEGLESDIPKNFNSSEQWPGCVHPIRDQQHCGSCWAFAASEVLSDRFCIASNKSVDVVLSPQDLVSCNNILNHGCNGGVPLFSWWHIADYGLVTDACLPYQSGSGKNPVSCSSFKQCADGSAKKPYYSKKWSTVSLKSPASIQANILQYGPVEAAFEVYEDFMYYAGGIYKHTTGSLLGGHAVKIIGWGNENNTDYWIVANSWNTTWGEDGFFRIAFGEVGIDTGCIAGQADLERSQTTPSFNFW